MCVLFIVLSYMYYCLNFTKTTYSNKKLVFKFGLELTVCLFIKVTVYHYVLCMFNESVFKFAYLPR